ncbi:MAG: Modification methylase BspRI [Firmicutes bacterium ADurb.Bin506]|nr:MAG: Modification methylase BspRI [Firmicutes bacterium ADurb.Bin506]
MRNPVVKPPYRVPLVAEINATKGWSGLTACSTFSGAGGNSLGLKIAGFDVRYASEFVPAAQDTYRANHPGTFLDDRDIRLVQPEDILKAANLRPGELDLLDGSPPCKSFSTSGKRDKGWGAVSHYCVAPDTRVLLSDMTWAAAGNIREGAQVVAFDEAPINGASRKFKPATVTGVDRVWLSSKRIELSDGTVVVCSDQHRWLTQRGARQEMWVPTAKLKVGDHLRTIGTPWEKDYSYEAGWLSGLFDGEGSVCAHGPESPQNRARNVQVAQLPGPVLDRAMAAMTKLGIQFGYHPNKQSGVVNLVVAGGMGARLRALGILRPTRLLPKAALMWDGVTIKAAEEVRIVSITAVGEVELVAFSTTAKTFIAEGLLSHNSDGIYQRTDDLFFEYVRLLGGLRPKVFIAENVTGLVKGSAVGYFKEVIMAMQKHGYRVKAGLLNGAWCGVPQARERILYLGVREDLGVDPSFPAPLPYHYTVEDAWQGLTVTEAEVAECVHLKPGHFLHTAWHMTMPGDNFIPAAQRMKGRASYFDYRRLGRHLPAPTIKATPGGLYHPDVPRSCAIPELRRLSGLPDDFQLLGTYEQRWERCGRLVPPPMYAHLAAHVRDRILKVKS